MVLNFIIDERNCEKATFDYYLNEKLNIKSVTLKSILFYNSWWIGDFNEEDELLIELIYKTIKTETREEIRNEDGGMSISSSFSSTQDNVRKPFKLPKRHFSLAEFCRASEEAIKRYKVDHVKDKLRSK